MIYRFFLILQKATLLKVFNSFKLRLSYLIKILFSSANINGMPEAMSVEPASICNLKCPQCTVGRGELIRQNNFMDKSLYERLINHTYKYLWHIFIYFQGEPFLNPDFFEFVRFASKRKIYTAASTNGHYLTDDNCKKLVKSGLDEIIISLDGLNPDEYKQYRQGGDFYNVVDGIKTLVRVKKELKSRTPLINLQFIVFSHNESSAAKFKSFAKELGADISQLKTAQLIDISKVGLLPLQEKYRRYKVVNGKAVMKKRLKNRCWRMWHSAVVNSDGVVVPCCFDKNADFPLGNIADKDFKQIWVSGAYNKFRNLVFTSRSNIPMCNNCSE